MLKTLDDEWRVYWNYVKPSKPGSNQEYEMKKAFMAGALVSLIQCSCATELPDDQAVAHLQSLMAQCDQFRKEIIRRASERN